MTGGIRRNPGSSVALVFLSFFSPSVYSVSPGFDPTLSLTSSTPVGNLLHLP